jgi:hypothetical protein
MQRDGELAGLENAISLWRTEEIALLLSQAGPEGPLELFQG